MPCEALYGAWGEVGSLGGGGLAGRFIKRIAMRNVVLVSCIVLGLSGGSAQPMDIRSMKPKDIIITGVVAGLSIQAAVWVCKHEHYKQAWPFIKNYPGYAIAGVSALVGLALMYGRPFTSVFSGYSLVKK